MHSGVAIVVAARGLPGRNDFEFSRNGVECCVSCSSESYRRNEKYKLCRFIAALWSRFDGHDHH